MNTRDPWGEEEPFFIEEEYIPLKQKPKFKNYETTEDFDDDENTDFINEF